LKFVLTAKGVGKYSRAEDGGHMVSYFHSPGDGEHVERCEYEPHEFELNPMTRAYYRRSDGSWSVGSILKKDASFTDHTVYQVVVGTQANNRAIIKEFGVSRLSVRWSQPVDDPSVELQEHCFEASGFYFKRAAVRDLLNEQRRKARGMGAILSSAIKLVPHQIEVVRRVLEDPIQRFLLADEVGLGKTSEAGLIIRQHVIDHPVEHSIGIVVPSHLCVQWDRELREKFYLGPQLSNGSIKVQVATDAGIRSFANRELSLLVVDEAHTWFQGNRRYAAEFVELAKRTPRLLLLSATPVHHNVESFLPMLRLLDPGLYSTIDLDEFRDRMKKHNVIARAFSTLRPDSAVMLRHNLNKLRTAFPKDEALMRLMGLAQQSAEKGPDNRSATEDIVDRIKLHIGETYRLDRRVLRNSKQNVDRKFSHGRKGLVFPESDCQAIRRLHEYRKAIDQTIDNWRHALQDDQDADPDDYREIYLALLQESFSSPEAIINLVKFRRAVGEIEIDGFDFDPLKVCCGEEIPIFDGEQEALVNIVNCARTFGTQPWVEAVVSSLRSIETSQKAIVFVRHERLADDLNRAIQIRFGTDTSRVIHQGTNPNDIRPIVDRFHHEPSHRFLVADSRAEDGMNLQCASCVVHADLPIDPNRFEQRLGRADRFGSLQPIVSLVPAVARADADGIEVNGFQKWVRYLDEVYRVFDMSISNLLYWISKNQENLECSLLESGLSVIDDYEQARDGVKKERQEIGFQLELDSIRDSDDGFLEGLTTLDFDPPVRVKVRAGDTASSIAHQHGVPVKTLCKDNDWDNPLEDVKAGTEAVIKKEAEFVSKFRKATKVWLKTLRWRTVEQDDGTIRFKYGFNSRVDGLQTNVPLHPDMDKYFSPGMDPTTGQAMLNHSPSLEFGRDEAIGNPRAQLARYGQRFIGGMDAHMAQDARGTSFALCRIRPTLPVDVTPYLAFRYDYRIEADASFVRKWLSKSSPRAEMAGARRMLDGLFPPIYHTVWINENAEAIEDSAILSLLQAPQLLADTGVNRDVDLRNANIYWAGSQPGWSDTVQTTTKWAKRLMFEHVDLGQIKATRLEEAKRKRDEHLSKVKLRQLAEMAEDVEWQTAFWDQIIAGVQAPSIVLDCMGVMVLKRGSGT
jgi:ATP-dependent helicase HepA